MLFTNQQLLFQRQVKSLHKVPVAVESTSDTTLSTAQSDSDLEAELVIIRKNKKKKCL